jgi:hypothetical protein
MDITGLLRALSNRATWQDARKLLVLAGLDPAQGWDKTIDRFDGAEQDQEVYDTLSDLLIGHLIAGEKSLQFYRLTGDQLAALTDHAQRMRVMNSEMREAFPESIDVDGVDPQAFGRPRLVHKAEVEAGIFLITTSVREYDERVEVRVDELSPAIQRVFGEYSQVIGVRKVRRQVFDTLWVPTRGRTVCIAADLPRGSPSDFAVPGQRALRELMRMAIGVPVEPMNLFPLISEIYESDWGKVVELGFTTDTASVKHERMRLKRQCLRQELFHKGGKEAVDGVIHPFHISVDWAASYAEALKGRPELTLHGTARMLHQPVPVLYDAVLRHGLNLRDLRRVKSRIMSFV